MLAPMTDRTENANLSIGQFGRLCQLSRKALRLYEDRGILTPARIDGTTGYRYYAREQVATARRIRLLRMMAMPLEQIAAVLQAWDADVAEVQRLLQLHLRGMEKQLDGAQLAARLLLEEITPVKERKMSFTFVEKEMPAQMVVSIRRQITIPAYHQWITPALRRLADHVKSLVPNRPASQLLRSGNEGDDGPMNRFRRHVIRRRSRFASFSTSPSVRTFGEYNSFLLLGCGTSVATCRNRTWAELGRRRRPSVWHEDKTMTIGGPSAPSRPPPRNVRSFRTPGSSTGRAGQVACDPDFRCMVAYQHRLHLFHAIRRQ